MKTDKYEEKAIACVPPRIRKAICRTQAFYRVEINEIRLRENRETYITSRNNNIQCGVVATKEDVFETVRSLAGYSLYSYEEEIKSGVIPSGCGLRAGVCGTADVRGGKICSVRDITSVSIRIPHRIPHAADGLYNAVREYGSVIVFSPPGRGKTTALRELIPLLAGGDGRARVSVIDTRYELSAFAKDCECADFFIGYPRDEGIRAAVTAMSPEYIISDEISTPEDADAIIYAHSCGVNVICSAHAGNLGEIKNNPCIKKLYDSTVFRGAYEINENGGMIYSLTDSN